MNQNKKLTNSSYNNTLLVIVLYCKLATTMQAVISLKFNSAQVFRLT